jgi:carboxyl-terminal processing protease
VLFPPAGFKKFVGFLDGKPQAGIGTELDVDPRTHAVRIVEIFLDSPAETSGLRVGDTITSIDGNPPPATTPDAVARALRGAPGTTVRIGFMHDGVPQEPITIVRRIFAPPDVTTRILTDGIAYIRIRSFGAHAPQELDVSIGRLRVVKPRAYILDLRANGGGYRDAAVAIGGRFVHGTIVTTQERTGKPVVFAAKSGVVPLGMPLAVLVDGDTASAAEIVAGAIQDEKTGTLVGTRTFGKGLVQETFALPDGGAIKLTTARYLTPAGRDIDKVGITPDVIVAQPQDAHPGETGRDAQLDRAVALLKASLPTPPSSSPQAPL